MAPGNGGKASILVADDNADMRDYLRQLLGQRYGSSPDGQWRRSIGCAAGEIGLDLVLADIMMPELDGYGLLAAVRSEPRSGGPARRAACRPAPARKRPSRGWTPARTSTWSNRSARVNCLPAYVVQSGACISGRRSLRESEERFRALVTATSDVVYRMSPDWTEMWALDGRGILADTQSPSVDWIEEYILPEERLRTSWRKSGERSTPRRRSRWSIVSAGPTARPAGRSPAPSRFSVPRARSPNGFGAASDDHRTRHGGRGITAQANDTLEAAGIPRSLSPSAG